MTLLDRERQLVDRYQDVDWDGPELVSVPGELTRLTCRFCTALNGLKASELAQVGFFTREDWRAHVDREHHESS